MLDKITKALGGSSSLATAPSKGLLDRIDTLELKAAEEGHAARGIPDCKKIDERCQCEAPRPFVR
jgi:hypothetical protein